MKLKIYFFITFLFFAFSCRKDIITENTPENVFLSFWQLMDENYVFFEEKGIDWDSIYSVYYPRAKEAKDRYALYGIFSEIIPQFKDGHLAMYGYLSTDYSFDIVYPYWVGADLLGRETIYNGGEDVTMETLGFEEKKYSKNFKCYEHKKRSYAMISTYTMGKVIENTNTTAAELTKCINLLDCKDGLIFDIMNNGGGNVFDIVSLFFTGEKLLFYIQFKKGKGRNDFTEKIPQIVQGKGIVSETTPVIVLTGPRTFSAANVFAYITRDFPNVTLVGKKTGGGGGAIHCLMLPNSWILWAPFTKTFSIYNENMEYSLTPDVYVQKISEHNNEDVTNESDVIIKAIEVLDSINGN